ncbi:hypothetical protein NP493_489g00019 [Ridgeia piscesae]|uniref:RING-CH-type domain-containing protein n=1 Tax=Ridgeia piscesae TaxID=27915 RepID=A0AAD9KXD8_RIDPI|nr:hypothetical protein NP493_489g00019 [Ridgeia piscesae]
MDGDRDDGNANPNVPDIECVPELVTATKLDHESRGVAQHDPTEGRTIGAVSSHSSASSVVCRICQLTEKETGNKVETTGCGCHGSLGACHRECLQQWINTRRNCTCEICLQSFSLGVSPELLAEDSDRTTMAPLDQTLICADSRRTWFVIIFFLLMFATGAAVALTVYTHRDYLTIQMHVFNTTSMDVRTVQDYRFVYGLSISILIFCACMCLSVALVWAFAEVCLWPQERFLQHHQILELTRYGDDLPNNPTEFV